MIVNAARFIISNSSYDKCPADTLPEYAFIGRSNVGKSSLINMLTGRRDLAMTSSTPGKTMLINHFLINDSWYIVDLPGYGYARRSKADRSRLEDMISGYILNRQQMTNLFVLIDGRLKPQTIDLEFMEWLGENSIPFSIVFTKLDKLSAGAAKKLTADYCATLLEQWEELPPIFKTSSRDRRGRDAILNYIEEMNKIGSTTAESHTTTAASEYPGVAIDIADDEKVDDEAIEKATEAINLNPRDSEEDTDQAIL